MFHSFNRVCIILYLQGVKMNGIQTTASDGYLMATLRDYFFTNNFNFGQKASIVTSVIFESKDAFITLSFII